MATKKPAVAIALKHVDTTGIELKQIIGPPKDQDHKRRSLNTSIQRASHVPPTAAPFVPLVPVSAPPPRSQLHPHSSFCKSHPSLQKIERERIRSSGSLLTKIKRSMARITNNDDIEDDDSDSETDTDTDTDTDDDEDSVYELDDDTDVLNFVNFSGEEKLPQKSKRKKGRGKRKGRGGRGSKPVKGRGGHGHSKKSSTSGKSSNKHARAKSKALKLILYQKAVESLYDDISGNMQPRMGIAKVTPFAQTWPHYYKCSCLYSSIRMSIVLLLSLVGGFFQVFPLLLSFTWTKSVPFREIMLAVQWSVITALAIMTFALNKWRFRGIGTIGVGILCGLMVQELLFPGRYCYSLLGGSGTIPLDSYLNYTTASKMERYKPDMKGYASTILYTDSLAPSCYNTTTAQRASEPFAWAVAMPIERSSTTSNNQGGWRREVIFGTLTLPDILSLSLHGLSRTSSTGLMLYVYGCGWLPMLSGVMMGPIYVMGKYLPASIQFCPSLVKTANCTEEALWGMYAWCCIVLSLMVYRGTKRNQIARTGLITFIIFNIWIVTTEFILLYSGLLLLWSDGGYFSVDGEKFITQGVWSLLGSFLLTFVIHLIYLYIWIKYRCHKHYVRTEQRIRQSIEFFKVHPFLITDDEQPDSCCTHFLRHFLCLSENVVESTLVTHQFLHEQTPFRMLLVLMSLISFLWTVACFILLIMQSQSIDSLF